MNSKHALSICKRLKKLTNSAISIDQEVWSHTSGTDKVEYRLWLNRESKHYRFNSFPELLQFCKDLEKEVLND